MERLARLPMCVCVACALDPFGMCAFLTHSLTLTGSSVSPSLCSVNEIRIDLNRLTVEHRFFLFNKYWTCFVALTAVIAISPSQSDLCPLIRLYSKRYSCKCSLSRSLALRSFSFLEINHNDTVLMWLMLYCYKFSFLLFFSSIHLLLLLLRFRLIFYFSCPFFMWFRFIIDLHALYQD